MMKVSDHKLTGWSLFIERLYRLTHNSQIRTLVLSEDQISAQKMVIMKYARCNLDGKPIHPGDIAVIDKFREWLSLSKEAQQAIIQRKDPEWMPFLLGEDIK